MTIKNVGFIGLGTMGAPMARRILGAFPLFVYDINAEAVARLVSEGATACSSPADVAARSDAVCSIVPDSPEVQEVILGDSGVLRGARPGTLLMEMSTIDPAVTESIASRVTRAGSRMIDAPVFRSVKHAERGELLIVVGGAKEDVDEAVPVLERMADTIHHFGPVGAGLRMKLVNNMLAQSIALSVCEALTLGVKAGLDLEPMLKVLAGTATSNKMMESVYPERGLSGDFSLGFALDWAHKDVGHALRLAARVGAPCPAASMAHAFQNIARSQGKGRWDHTALLTVFEAMAGVTLRKR
jgi:3-hydroxyisobutyrate dehydrogenase-like beta-hydroxyacid dehydrogenase